MSDSKEIFKNLFIRQCHLFHGCFILENTVIFLKIFMLTFKLLIFSKKVIFLKCGEEQGGRGKITVLISNTVTIDNT